MQLNAQRKNTIVPRPGSNMSGGPSINKLQKLADKEQDEIADITEDEDDDIDQFGEPVVSISE